MHCVFFEEDSSGMSVLFLDFFGKIIEWSVGCCLYEDRVHVVIALESRILGLWCFNDLCLKLINFSKFPKTLVEPAMTYFLFVS